MYLNLGLRQGTWVSMCQIFHWNGKLPQTDIWKCHKCDKIGRCPDQDDCCSICDKDCLVLGDLVRVAFGEGFGCRGGCCAIWEGTLLQLQQCLSRARYEGVSCNDIRDTGNLPNLPKVKGKLPSRKGSKKNMSQDQKYWVDRNHIILSGETHGRTLCVATGQFRLAVRVSDWAKAWFTWNLFQSLETTCVDSTNSALVLLVPKLWIPENEKCKTGTNTPSWTKIH